MRSGLGAQEPQAKGRGDNFRKIWRVEPADAFSEIGSERRRARITPIDKQPADDEEAPNSKVRGKVFTKRGKRGNARQCVNMKQSNDGCQYQPEAVEVVLAEISASSHPTASLNSRKVFSNDSWMFGVFFDSIAKY